MEVTLICFGFPAPARLFAHRLAQPLQSLVRDSRRALLVAAFRRTSHKETTSQLVSHCRPFHRAPLSLAVLLRYRSRDRPFPWEVSTSRFTVNYQPLLLVRPASFKSRLRASHSPPVLLPKELRDVHNTYAYPQLRLRIQVGNSSLRSPLLRQSLLLPAPPPTNMLKFGGYSRQAVSLRNTP